MHDMLLCFFMHRQQYFITGAFPPCLSFSSLQRPENKHKELSKSRNIDFMEIF